jgi:hypothetical protein
VEKQNRQPIQPIYLDDHGSPRFQDNEVVVFLFIEGKLSLDKIEIMDFPQTDKEQFAQLLGCSVKEFCEFGFTSEEARSQAKASAKKAKKG